MNYYEAQDFIHKTPTPLKQSEFLECHFKDNDFSNLDLSYSKFIECTFEDTNLSNITINSTTFRDVSFTNCKLLGLNWSGTLSLSELKFVNCLLNFCVFQDVNLQHTTFDRCQIHETDFSQSNLKHSLFNETSLKGSLFNQSDLRHCDLKSATNYFIDPNYNKISKAKFSTPEVITLLSAFDIEID